ncbi:putative negative regulator of RcsB-dependent stress response [Gelidibacter algens]|uniref:Putative negative regulator of RcsB-dependent stress response n=2 Tax=Gelidibacter algens TaxID=49280 RepID=A0A327S934_9FLAO|nr:putative negative regulator of RcsB-dependent stress response [Gelidibacter algens]
MRRTNYDTMATYKKRGYKPKTQAEKTEALEDNSTTAEVFNTLDESASRTEEWAVKNQNYIIGAVAVIALVALSYLGYNKFVAEPKASLAMNDMFQAQQYFEQAVNGVAAKDSLYTLSLNGGEGKFGMLDIINEYGGTPAADLATYYAGMAYYNLNDYQNTVKYLSDFSGDDLLLAPIANGRIGDAFVQLNQPEDALSYYEKAASMNENGFTTPMYLFKAGNVALTLGKTEAALEHFNTIKETYPTSSQAANIEVFIGQAQASL